MLISNSEKKKVLPNFKLIKDKKFISGGYIGKEDDYVVDDTNCPTLVLGKLNSKGEIIPIKEELSQNILSEYFNK